MIYRTPKKNTAYSTKLMMKPAGPVNCTAAMIAVDNAFAIRAAHIMPARKIAHFFTFAESIMIVGVPDS